MYMAKIKPNSAKSAAAEEKKISHDVTLRV